MLVSSAEEHPAPLSHEEETMHRFTLGSTVAFAGLLAITPGSAGAQQVAVDAAVRVSPHLAIAIHYGQPYVAPVYVRPVPRRRAVRRIVDWRELERAHRRWHERAARAHDRLHYDLAHGYVSAREHAAWHRRMAREHQELYHDLDHRYDGGWEHGR